MWIKVAIYKAVGVFISPLWKLSCHKACTRTELGIVVNLILLLKQHKILPTIVQELCTQMPCSCKNFTDFSIKHLIKLSGSALATYFSPGKIQVLTAYQLLLLFFFWLKFLSYFWAASLRCPWWFKLFLPNRNQETFWIWLFICSHMEKHASCKQSILQKHWCRMSLTTFVQQHLESKEINLILSCCSKNW